MRYAIIADIHGNMPAFKAVLEDAKQMKVDGFIFLGDYCLFSPFPNEVIDTIKTLPNAYVIRGNHEDYFNNISTEDNTDWINGQFATLHWTYNELTEENLDYIYSLPSELTVDDSNIPIRISHYPQTYFNNTKVIHFKNSTYSKNYIKKPFSKNDFSTLVNNTLSNDSDLKEVLSKLPNGIYAFGHTHLQWHFQLDDKLLINPGSCGIPLDCLTGASYTIIDTSKNKFEVIERRVQYNIEKTIDTLLESDLFKKSNVLSSIVATELSTAFGELHAFFDFVHDYSVKVQDDSYPYSKEVWNNAYELWESQKHDYILNKYK